MTGGLCALCGATAAAGGPVTLWGEDLCGGPWLTEKGNQWRFVLNTMGLFKYTGRSSLNFPPCCKNDMATNYFCSIWKSVVYVTSMRSFVF